MEPQCEALNLAPIYKLWTMTERLRLTEVVGVLRLLGWVSGCLLFHWGTFGCQ